MAARVLRAGIDVSPLALTRAGTARYVRSLVAALGREEAVELRPYSFAGPTRAAKVARDVAWYTAALPLAAARERLDVLHCTTFRAPFKSRVPLVVTFHDVAVLRHPNAFNRWTRAYSRALLPLVARAAARIIAVSEFTRRELVDLLHVAPEKIRVIPNGVGPPFSPDGPSADGDYVLAVSTLEPRKNLPRLVEAFGRAALDGCDLVVVGARGWGDVTVAGERVRWLGEVGDDELARLYRGARCVAYPSLYEGFGLPVLEAMACGAPVVTARDGAPAEVADGAAILVDPHDRDAITAGLEQAVERRDELSARGRERAARFDWQEVARRTLGVYREAAA